MSARISKRVREDAIHCLEQCASDWISGFCSSTTDVYQVGSYAQWLAADALHYVVDMCRTSVHIAYLEAAALLRDGWSPGEPVVQLVDLRDMLADREVAP